MPNDNNIWDLIKKYRTKDPILKSIKEEIKLHEEIVELIELFRILTIYSLKLNDDALFKEFGDKLDATISKIKTFLIKNVLKKFKKEFIDKRTQFFANVEKFDEFVLNGALKIYNLDFKSDLVSKNPPDKNDLIRKLVLAFFDLAIIQDICIIAPTQEGEWIFYTIAEELRKLKWTAKNLIYRMEDDRDFDSSKIPYIGSFFFWTWFD